MNTQHTASTAKPIAQHTPGPWYSLAEYSNGGEVHSARGIVCDASIGLLDCPEYRAHYRAESMANARLIAAAPELLDALVEMLEASERPVNERWLSNVRSHARAAIQKAEGRA